MKSKAVILFISFLVSLAFPALSNFSNSSAANSNLPVNFSNNGLTVKSQKSMLIDILREVCEKTGVMSVIKTKTE